MNVYPVPVFLVSLTALSLAAWIGSTRFSRMRAEVTTMRDEFGIIQGATLTLLGLIVGFTFSMALSRYEQRKNYEEEEANAIGTEYLRAELLPAADAARVRALLREYVDQRMLFYTTRDLERNSSRSMPRQPRCRPNCGPRSRRRPLRSRRRCLPSPSRA